MHYASHIALALSTFPPDETIGHASNPAKINMIGQHLADVLCMDRQIDMCYINYINIHSLDNIFTQMVWM